MATILCERVGDSFCMVAGSSAIRDDDWDGALAMLVEGSTAGSTVRIVVHAKLAGPSAMQRARLYAVGLDRKIIVAVLTGSPAARGVLQAFGWAAKIKIKAFAVDNLAEAMSFLGTPAGLEPKFSSTIAKLGAQVP